MLNSLYTLDQPELLYTEMVKPRVTNSLESTHPVLFRSSWRIYRRRNKLNMYLFSRVGLTLRGSGKRAVISNYT